MFLKSATASIYFHGPALFKHLFTHRNVHSMRHTYGVQCWALRLFPEFETGKLHMWFQHCYLIFGHTVPETWNLLSFGSNNMHKSKNFGCNSGLLQHERYLVKNTQKRLQIPWISDSLSEGHPMIFCPCSVIIPFPPHERKDRNNPAEIYGSPGA